MKITFISNSVSRHGGGISEIERELAQHLSRTDNNIINVLGLRDAYSEEDMPAWQPVEPKVFSVKGPDAFGFAPGLWQEVRRIDPDILHLNSLWKYPSVITKRWHVATRQPYVVTVNGMLDPWAVNNSRWKKQIAAWLYESENLKKAACLVANSFKELEAIRQYGLNSPVAIIPNGVYLPQLGIKDEHLRSEKKLLYLGRIHPKKGLENLVAGWEQAKMKGDTRWKLHIVGWGAEKDIMELKQQIKDSTSIHFHGPKFGDEKAAIFRDSDAFILPSFSEGMPMAILEAWSYALPVLMTPECNLEVGYQKGAAIEIQTDVKSLKMSLESVFKEDSKLLQQMGARGRKLVEHEFSWEKAACQLQEVYKWLLHKKPRPDFVYQ